MDDIKKRYGRILVATDFSDAAEVACRGAARLALGWGAAVEIVHALPPARYAAEVLAGSESELLKQLEQAALIELTRVQKESFSGLEVSLAALQGTSPAMAVVDHAEKSGADLCIVGSHGRTGLSRMLIGSVAEAIVRHAPCDVLCIPPGVDVEALPPKRILAPTDFSELAERGLAVAGALARSGPSQLTLVHVLDAMHPAIPAAAFAEEKLSRHERHAALSSYRAEHLADLTDVATEVEVEGSPADAICRLAATADLVVLATHGRTGLSRLLIGSVAERVVRHAPCATLVVRARGA